MPLPTHPLHIELPADPNEKPHDQLTMTGSTRSYDSYLDRLPTDLLWIIVFQNLSLLDLSRLARTCRLLHAFVEEFGWSAYTKSHLEPYFSLTPALESSKWRTRDLLRYQTLAREAWASRKFHTRPLGPEWSTNCHPKLAISASRLIVAAGNTLFVYRFTPPVLQGSEQPRTIFERTVTFPRDARRDITGITFVGSEGRELLLAFANGALAFLQLPHPVGSAKRRKPAAPVRAVPVYIREDGPSIRALSATSKLALTLDSAGGVSMYSLTDPNPIAVSSMDLGVNSSVTGWSVYLMMQSRSGYAAIGTASHRPLVVHDVTESGLDPVPQANLSPSAVSPAFSAHAAVYSICGATQTFPFGSSSPQMVISGWYHGSVLVHDLRTPTHSTREGACPTLHPVLSLHDPVVRSPVYSLSSAGPYIVAGAGEHSLMHLFDVRSPRRGWSIYLPQPQRRHSISSPVYSCLLESTRIWAALHHAPLLWNLVKVTIRTPSLLFMIAIVMRVPVIPLVGQLLSTSMTCSLNHLQVNRSGTVDRLA